MDRPTAEGYVRLFAAVDEEPTLGQGDLEIILDLSRRKDVEGLVYTDTEWIPTFDLNFAISRAWRAKAAKAAGKYTFLQGGNQFIRSDMIRHCLQMSDEWSKGIHDSLLNSAWATATVDIWGYSWL